MGNACVSSLISHNMGKDSQTHQMGKDWKIGSRWCPRKPIVCRESGKLLVIHFQQYRCFFPLDSHPMISFITWKMHGFPHQFSIAWKMQRNPSNWESLGNWYPFFPWRMALFFHQIPILLYTLSHGKCMVFPSISNNTGKCSKIYLVSFLVVFPEYSCFYLFQNLVIP